MLSCMIFSNSLKKQPGEWDFRNNNEMLPDEDFNVSSIRVHPQFDNRTARNNIAIFRLSQNVDLGEFPTIGTACLPSMI
jgi:hypothetical protein